ncbi:uncharacterized protein LOC135698735 isoform X3 [Ochlerotatus camptorhynchus]|uniref:uncharacterized protein LOC135698735 isoform X3 n=1 Tax=Ochlerotatus camptorhynchus TaxID=644619 RepID=UPI0031E2F157
MFNELKFTPGVGFSLLIGAVGSIYLIVQSRKYFSKLSQRRRSEIRKPDVACYMCNANIEVEDTNSFATCRGCERLVCRSEGKQCSEWIPAIGIWECQNCHSSRVIQQKAGEWLLGQLTSRLQNPGPVNLKNDGLLGLTATDSDDAQSSTSSISSNQKVKVREFVEELLSSMLNGPLDDVPVGQLMKNDGYIKLFHRYHSRLSRCLYNLELSIHQSLSDLPMIEGQTEPASPSDTHFELRKMLQKILDEVTKLPELFNQSGLPLRPEEHLPYFSPKKYEQLLANAVLNKVVENYRNPQNFEHVEQQPTKQQPEVDKAGPPTTGATSAGSAPATGTTFDINHNKVPGKSLLNEANLRQMSLDKELKEDLYGRSLSESDESYLSDYIQKHTVPLPDLSDTTGSGSGPEDDLLSLKSNTTDGTWEENWLFKKRQLKATESSIAMLVPSPTEEVKALIGDKNADEVSDLSEAGSDVEDYDSDSNHKNTTTDPSSSTRKTEQSLEDHVQDSLISINSIASNEPVLSEAKNDLLLKEQSFPLETSNHLVDDLISIDPSSEKTEAANPALVDSELNSFLFGPESVLVEENNNIVKQHEVETDDVKLMQELIQNAPKHSDTDGNVQYPIGIARTIPVDRPTAECDRKEIPIETAPHNTEHKTKPNVTVSEVDVDNPSNPRSRNLNLSISPDQTHLEGKTTTILDNIRKPDPKPPTSAEPLSPHPIALNITEVYERSMKPPLMSISEEDLESNASTAFRSILSPSDSVTSTADESDYKTVSQNESSATTTAEADTDNSLMLDSLPSQHSLDSSAESSRHYREEEFSSINIGHEGQESDETSKPSLELLELNEASSGAVYVCDKSKLEFAEQLKELRQQQQHHPESEEKKENMDRNERIYVGHDLVAFNNNASSPEEMKEQKDRSLQNSLTIDQTRDEVTILEQQTANTTESAGDKATIENPKDQQTTLIEEGVEKPLHVSLSYETETQVIDLKAEYEQPENQCLPIIANPTQIIDPDLLEYVENPELNDKTAAESATIHSSLIDIDFNDSTHNGLKEKLVESDHQKQDLIDEITEQTPQQTLLHATEVCLETTKAKTEELVIVSETAVETAESALLQNVELESSPIKTLECIDLLGDIQASDQITDGSLHSPSLQSAPLPSNDSINKYYFDEISAQLTMEVKGDKSQRDSCATAFEENNRNEESEFEKSNSETETQEKDKKPQEIEPTLDVTHTESKNDSKTDPDRNLDQKLSSQEIILEQNHTEDVKPKNEENVETKIVSDVLNAHLYSEQQISKPCENLETFSVDSNDEVKNPEATFLHSISEESTFSSSTSEFTSTEPESIKSTENKTTLNTDPSNELTDQCEQATTTNEPLNKNEVTSDLEQNYALTVHEYTGDKRLADVVAPTTSVDSAVKLDDELISSSNIETTTSENLEKSSDPQNQPPERTQTCEAIVTDSEHHERLSPTPGSVPNPPDILLGTTEALDESDSEHLKSNDGLPSQSGSSSPTDTSTEAIAGSVDRASSPEESYSALTDEKSTISNGQLKLQDSEQLFSLSRTPSPEKRRHSTPIAIVTQQMRQYCEELKGILYPPKSPETETEVKPQTPENLDALQLFQEELRAANEDPSQCDVKPCKDHPIQAIPPNEGNVPVSGKLLTPMEEFAIRTAKYNHILRNIDYVEESVPIAEEAECLMTQNVEQSTVDAVLMVTPSAEEHAVNEAIVVEHTPTPEPVALTQVSYERQTTSTVEELETVYHPNDSFDFPPPPPPEILEKVDELNQCDPEISSLSIPLATVCVLTNNSDTNLTIIVDTTNNANDQQPPSFLSEASISIEEPDSSQSQQIPAQSAPEKQKPSELANGHVPTTTNGSTDDSGEEEKLIPGSIAEREHLKWRNASPIANNPYSPDVLQKRLEESNRKSSMFDFDRLADRALTSPTMEVPDEPELVLASKDDDDTAEKDRSLQSVVGSNPNRYQRYGRDYYINDAKRACGSRKETPDLSGQLTHSTDDEKSLLLSQKQDQPTSPTHSNGNDLRPAGAFPFVKSNSCGNVINNNQSEDIFSAARPIAVAPGDPILKKGTKVECLSTQDREVYLVPTDEPITPCSLGSSSELSMTSRPDDSLTYSEDSDVTRIYEIGTGESKVIHGDAIGSEKDTSRTPPSTPTNDESGVVNCIDEEQTMNKLNSLMQQETELISEEIIGIIPQVRMPTPVEPDPIVEPPSSPTIDRSHLLKPHLVKMKPLSPETIKFFSPKKPFAAKGGNLSASSSLSQSSTEIRDLPHHPTSHYHSSLHIDYPPNRAAPIHHDFIIEKEVMEVLPSVKELAKCYSSSQQDVNAVPKPLHKPKVKLRKDFIRQSSDMLHEEENQDTRTGMPHVQNKNRRIYCSTGSISAAEEIREIRRMKVEAYNPPTFVPMAPGHSITARSLSKQIRDELKTNATDDHKVQGGGHASPERPSSPVFAPGHLRSSIQFFENLKEK